MSRGGVGRGLLTEYGDLDDRWTDLTGWNAQTWLAQVRQRLDIAHLPAGARLGEISGGEQARLTLARVLLESPDLLLLDEPTNHLDADGIAWLGDWLARFPGGILVVSHDRDFLDRVVTRIVELDGIHEEPQFYTGGYTQYRAEKAGAGRICSATTRRRRRTAAAGRPTSNAPRSTHAVSSRAARSEAATSRTGWPKRWRRKPRRDSGGYVVR